MTTTTDSTTASGLPGSSSPTSSPSRGWILESQDARYEHRLASSMDEMTGVLRHDDAPPPRDHRVLQPVPDSTTCRTPSSKLMLLTYSLIQASFPVEAWKQARVPDSGSAIHQLHPRTRRLTHYSFQMDVAEFRRELVAWLDEHDTDLRLPVAGYPTLEEELAQFCHAKRALFDAGWGRYGWAESVGGLGGSPMLRAVVGEEIAARDLAEAGFWSMIEVLAPTVITFGSPALVAEMLPPVLRGDETWCQGFSEPGTGSDLASLTCRATRDRGRLVGERTEGVDQLCPAGRALRTPRLVPASPAAPTVASLRSSSTWIRPGSRTARSRA